MSIYLAVFFVLISLAILWIAGNWFVEGAVGISEKFNIPRMIVGIVIVSLCTTGPELMASLLAALQGNPEVALGNAVGSVIVDDGVALGMAAILAPAALTVNPGIFKFSAIFLVIIYALSFLMVLDNTMWRWEGAVLLLLFCGYVYFIYLREKKRRADDREGLAEYPSELEKVEKALKGKTSAQIFMLFLGGLAGVLGGSKLLLMGALAVAEHIGLSPAVTGLTIVAIGTSVPEIVTAIVSAYKGESGVGIGNIIGADILNICWVAGLSSIVNPLSATHEEIFVMFPWMLAIVAVMLVFLAMGYKLKRWNGIVLVLMYAGFMVSALSLLSGQPEMVQAH